MKSLFAVLVLAAGLAQGADDAFMKGRRFAAGDYTAGKVCVVEADGKVSWSHPAKNCNDLWILPGGSILFVTGNGAKEVAFKDKAVLFEYNSPAEIYTAQRLPNGNTFIGECSSAKLLEVAPDGKVVKELAMIPPEEAQGNASPGGHLFMRNARVLPNGNFLLGHYAKREATEYAPDGKVVWRFKAPAGVHSVTRLANGNTIATGSDSGTVGVYEADASGAIVWQVTNADLPGEPLKFVTGFNVLPNGNILISNWVGHGQFGKAPHLLEITREKKVVWTFDDHENFKTIATVQVFGEGDAPLNGDGFH